MKHWLFWAVLLMPAWAWATDTGWMTGSSVTGGTNWTSTGNMYSSNDAWASYANSGNDVIAVHGFGASVPTDATVDSIFIRFEGNGASSITPRRRFDVGPTKDATSAAGETSTITVAETTDDSQDFTGGTTPLFNTTWTATEINASTFGVILNKNGNKSDQVNVDYVSVRVVYTEAAGGGPKRRVIFINK